MNSVIKEERFIRIIDYLKEKQMAKFVDIEELNNVSLDTVRRDLKELDKRSMLKLVRGGAIFSKEGWPAEQIDDKTLHCDVKRELIQLVGDLVSDGQAVALNSGATNTVVAKYLVENYLRLTILTNSLHIIGIMKKAKNFTVIVPGGIIDTHEGAIYGKSCERDILNYNIDLAILDIHAISSDKGITETKINSGGIISAMMQASKKRAVIADHTKFNRVSFINVCDLSNIDYILSDSKLTKETARPFEQKHIQIITPKK